MAVGTVVIVGGTILGTSGLVAAVGWRVWNKRMREESAQDTKLMQEGVTVKAGRTRKFLLGSESFGFLYGHSESNIQFFRKFTNGEIQHCSFPVAALKTAGAATVLTTAFTMFQMTGVPPVQQATFVSEINQAITPPITENVKKNSTDPA